MQHLLAKLFESVAYKSIEILIGLVHILLLSQPEWTVIILLWPAIRSSHGVTHSWTLLRRVSVIIVRPIIVAMSLYFEAFRWGTKDAFQSAQNLLHHPWSGIFMLSSLIPVVSSVSIDTRFAYLIVPISIMTDSFILFSMYDCFLPSEDKTQKALKDANAILANVIQEIELRNEARCQDSVSTTKLHELAENLKDMGRSVFYKSLTYLPLLALVRAVVAGLMGVLLLYYWQELEKRQVYRYKALKAEQNEIRLLRILPSLREDDKIRCEIRHVSLSENSLHYTALSYYWGDSIDQRLIQLNGCTLLVSKNLERALRQMRNRWLSTELWIDAICIDQASKYERAAQVLRMFTIYQKAQMVDVWLGLKADGSDKVMQMLSRSLSPSHSFDYAQSFQREGPESYESPNLEEVEAFLSRPYWQRVWIVQEIAAAKRTHLLCGDWAIEIPSVEQFRRGLMISESSDTPHLNRIQKIFDLRIARRTQKPIKFLDALSQTSHCASSQILDKVYGLLGLTFDHATFVPEPDYNLSKRQLCVTMTENAVLSTGSMDYMFLSRGCDRIADLPSWCPDYVSAAEWDFFVLRYITREDWSRPSTETGIHSSERPIPVLIDPAQGIFKIEGVLIATIGRSASAPDNPSFCEIYRVTPFCSCGEDEVLINKMFQRDDVISYTQTLLDSAGNIALQDLASTDIETRRNSRHSISKALLNTDSKHPAKCKDAQDYLLQALTEDMRLVRLEFDKTQYFGWVDPSANPGDQIFVFPGCSMPVVVRPPRKPEERFRFVGRAYAQIDMKNDAIQRMAVSMQLVEIS